MSGDPDPGSLGYTVELEATPDAGAEATRIASECGIAVEHILQFGGGFIAELDVIQLGCVRCDTQVKSVHGNLVFDPL